MAVNTKNKTKSTTRRIIRVSGKRQLTIPQKYYDALGFGNEAECILQEGGLLIRPVNYMTGGDFSEQILSDLLSQGYSGSLLMEKFIEYNRAVRPAVEKIIDEADSYVKSGNGDVPRDKLFGTEE